MLDMNDSLIALSHEMAKAEEIQLRRTYAKEINREDFRLNGGYRFLLLT